MFYMQLEMRLKASVRTNSMPTMGTNVFKGMHAAFGGVVTDVATDAHSRLSYHSLDRRICAVRDIALRFASFLYLATVSSL